MKTIYTKSEIQEKGYGLAKSIFEITKNLHDKKMKEFAARMRSTAMSIPLNIAEANSKKTKKHAALYLTVARGFLNKLDSDLERSKSLGIINSKNYRILEVQIRSMNNILSGFLKNRKN